MITQVSGRLLARELDRVEIMTAGGVAYGLQIPLSVYETLPRTGDEVTLHAHLVVREDEWLLFGFSTVAERYVFQKLLSANGIGPSLALAMLSNLTADRLVRAILDGDVATLQGVPRVGRKKAERLILDLGDKLNEVPTSGGVAARREGGVAGAEDAIRALVSLGYSSADAEKAVRGVLDEGGRGVGAPELIRRALARMAGR